MKDMIGNESGLYKRGFYNFQKRRGMHHHHTVHLILETQVTTMAEILKSNDLGKHSLKKVWHKGSCVCECAKCGRTHRGKYLLGHGVFFKCGKKGHFIRQCRKNK